MTHPVGRGASACAIAIRATGPVLGGRLLGLAVNVAAGVIAWRMWRDFDDAYRGFQYTRMMVLYGVIAAVHVPYSLGCLALESGLLPRVVVWSRPASGRRPRATRVMTWRSMWRLARVSSTADFPLEMTVTSKPRTGKLPGFKVTVTLRDFDRRARLRLVTTKPEADIERLVGALERAGVAVIMSVTTARAGPPPVW